MLTYNMFNIDFIHMAGSNTWPILHLVDFDDEERRDVEDKNWIWGSSSGAVSELLKKVKWNIRFLSDDSDLKINFGNDIIFISEDRDSIATENQAREILIRRFNWK